MAINNQTARIPHLLCPTCGSAPQRVDQKIEGFEILVANAICPNEHLWMVRWMGGVA